MSKHDLTTYEGRLAAIRSARERLSGRAEYAAAIADARRHDPFPVLRVEPGKGVRLYTRLQALRAVGREENSPEFWRLLSSEAHPPGTVFFVLFHGRQLTYARAVLTPEGLPEHG